MKITWFGHSAYKIEFAETVMMIDPFLSGSPVYDGEVMAAAKGATHVALTHGHDDHIGDTVEICQTTGATLIAVYELAVWLNGHGVETIEPTNTGGSVYTDDFSITFVRADHSSSSGNIYLGNPCGLIVRAKAEATTLYHMGDSDIFGDMALINELYKPDIGIVPIGDRFTMNPCTASLACTRFFDFKTILPCHHDTFPFLTGKVDEFAEGLGDQASRLKVLKIGETIDV